MNRNLLSSIGAKILPLIAFSLMALLFVDCKSEVNSKKQQKAFYVDKDGNLMNKKNELIKKAGDFKLDKGYYVDSNGNQIKRGIDKTKDKINEKVDNTKEKLGNATANTKEKLDNTKEKLGNAAAKSKVAIGNAANKTTASVKESFNDVFNTKAVGAAFPFSSIKFDKESHRITDMDRADVDGLVAALKEHPESRIQVQVHTADGKNKIESKTISKLRAEVVRDMLVTLGVKKGQISAKGMGLTNEGAVKAAANAVEVIVEK